MAHIYKPVSVKPVPKSAAIVTDGGKRFARWTARGNRKVSAEITPDGTRCRVESPTWWIEYRDGTGKRSRAAGFRDRAATMALAVRLENKARAVRGGYDLPDRPEGPEHLADHLDEFAAALANRGGGAKYVADVLRHVRATVVGMKLTTPAAVDPDRVSRWVKLETDRLGWSTEHHNRRIQYLCRFGKWLVANSRAQVNPFTKVPTMSTRGQKTRDRRRLDHEHLVWLIDTTRVSPPHWRLTGEERANLYLLAAYTGLRRGALFSLTPGSFAWGDGSPVSVSITAKAAKNKKPHTVPLHPDVGGQLANWLLSRADGVPLWRLPARSPVRTAQMLRDDLAAARAAWIDMAGRNAKERARREASDVLCYRDHAGEVFDFHSFRVQFISSLAISGVPLTAAQKLADHASPMLTANVYTKWGGELAGEVAKLPGLGSRLGSELGLPCVNKRKTAGAAPRRSVAKR